MPGPLHAWSTGPSFRTGDVSLGQSDQEFLPNCLIQFVFVSSQFVIAFVRKVFFEGAHLPLYIALLTLDSAACGNPCQAGHVAMARPGAGEIRRVTIR